jgi:hemoglobin-like flavoprotein
MIPRDRLTPVQRARIRETLETLRPMLAAVASLFYGKVFELDPSARRLFHIDLAEQGRKIMNTLESIAQSLDHLDTLNDRLAELGRQHASYGVKPEQYETVTKALLWALAQALGFDFDQPTREAWTLALAHICDQMKRGASTDG